MLNFIVIKSEINELNWLESFFQKLSWKMTATTDLREAVNLILKYDPDYVLVSADHPNKQTHLLAKLTTGKSRATLIGFTENPKDSSFTKLYELSFKHLLSPPVSSLDLLKLINKIEKTKTIKSEKPAADYRELINISSPDKDQKKGGVFISKGVPWSRSHTIIKGEAKLENSRRPSLMSATGTQTKPEMRESLINASVMTLNKVLGQNELNGNCTLISEVTEVSYLRIDSDAISGMMVIATGKNEVLDETIKNDIKQILYQQLKSKGFNALDVDANTPALKINKVSFFDWSLKKADFTLNSVYQNNEIAISFFTTSELNDEAEKSYSEEMIQIKLSELEVGTEAKFQLFIYLPNNKKYVVFNKIDTALSVSDFERLKKNSIEYVHFKRENLPLFKQLKAQNFLNRQMDVQSV